MASVQDCERALQALAARLEAVDADTRARHAVDRTIACFVPDLDVVFAVDVAGGTIGDLRCSSTGAALDQAQVRLTAGSDDLIALVTGALSPPLAWATGKVKVEASVLDLLRLRSLL